MGGWSCSTRGQALGVKLLDWRKAAYIWEGSGTGWMGYLYMRGIHIS